MRTRKQPVALTREENIERVYSRFLNESAHDEVLDVPERRRLKVGDKVEIGNLENVTVIDVRDDFRHIIVEYSRTDNNRGNPITTDGHIGCWEWYNIIPLRENETSLSSDGYRIQYFQTTLNDGVIRKLLKYGINDSPIYQRGYVWNETDKEKLIDSIMNGRDIGKFVFVQDKTYKTVGTTILDGKQRSNAIIEFITSKFPYKGKYWDELSCLDRDRFESRLCQVAELDSNRYTERELIEIFLDVNAAGVPQTEEHLAYVRGLLNKEG